MGNEIGQGVDFVGDIHGNAKSLRLLLDKLGYNKDNGNWNHPENRVLLVLGDFINSGYESKEVLTILYELWNQKIAYILIGNHEYFLAWNYFKKGREALKPDGPLEKEYQRFLTEFVNEEELLIKYCEWIYILPFYIETDGFRAVHAYWSENNQKTLSKYKNLSDLWYVFAEDKIKKTKKIKKVINETVSGKMAVVYNPCKMEKPEYYRVKWWRNLYGKNLLDGVQVNNPVKCPSMIITPEILPDFVPYGDDEKPVFFGHYWFKTLPCLLRNNACCLDFGAAKGGYLTAYRWNGERMLNANNLIWI